MVDRTATSAEEMEGALRDIADMRLDGKTADFHFYGSDEAQVEAMKERARSALRGPVGGEAGQDGEKT